MTAWLMLGAIAAGALIACLCEFSYAFVKRLREIWRGNRP